jgi:hypothetical protein
MYTFSTCLFFFCFFQQYVHFSFSPLDCDLCKPQLQAGSIGIYFSKRFFLSKKLPAHKKKREFLIFFQNPNFFFAICFLFDKKKKKKQDEKYHTRTTLPRAIFSLFFVFQNMVARWRSTCSWKLPICYNSTLQLYIQHFRMQLYKD